MALSIVFMGTPAFSVPVLEAVHEAGHRIVAVYTQPPRPAGRGLNPTASPVHLRAGELGLPVLTPKSFKEMADRRVFAEHKADAAVVVAYGLLLPEEVLSAPSLGCFNVHASLLPRWRGAAPIQRAIMAGDAVTGVTIMRMEKGLDTGPMCIKAEVPIAPMTTAGDLHDRLSQIGAGLMVEALGRLEAGTLPSTVQPSDGVTYAAKIDKREAHIDFSKPAAEVRSHIHGLSPAPGAWFEVQTASGPERIKLLAVEVVPAAHPSAGDVLDDALTIACGVDSVRPIIMQRAGKKAAPSGEVLRGFKVPIGTKVA